MISRGTPEVRSTSCHCSSSVSRPRSCERVYWYSQTRNIDHVNHNRKSTPLLFSTSSSIRIARGAVFTASFAETTLTATGVTIRRRDIAQLANMPYASPHPPLDIPKCNILSYLYPKNKSVSEKPLWREAANPDNNLSPAQMLVWVKRFAVGMDNMGIEKQRAIMVFTPNHIFVPMAYLAAAGSGRCFTGANPVYTTNEIAHQMKTIDAALVLIHPSLLKTGLAAAKQAGISRNRLFLFSDRPEKSQDGLLDWREIVASEAEARTWTWDPLEGQVSMTTVAAINFSSGTTGLPKGVCITHRNLVSNTMQALSNKFNTTNETEDNFGPERWVAFLPLYHAYSQLWTINCALRLQVEVYVMTSFVFEDFLKYVSKYKVTHIQAVPPVLVMLSKRPEAKKYDIKSLKHILCGAAPLSRELQNEINNRYGAVVAQGWGMSETTCGAISTPGMTNDTTGSIGHLFPNTEGKLVDDDGNEVTAENSPGELWVRGPQMLLEYWRNEQATRDSYTSDRWFKTGDVAVRQGTKWWIVDRKKELIKVNGLQVPPAELEAVLLEHDKIVDAAVTGITLHGEELPIAYVVLQEAAQGQVTEEHVQDFVKDKVAKHKQLKGGVKFVDSIPKLASGKIVRKLMKEWAKRDQKEMEGKVRARL